MIKFPNKIENGNNVMDGEVPEDCISRVFNGIDWICYQREDAVPPIDYKHVPEDIISESDVKTLLKDPGDIDLIQKYARQLTNGDIAASEVI